MASEQFSLCWDNFHKNMSSGMNSLLENEDLVDVTLAVEGKYLKAHKMVLSVCSPYFKELFKVNPCKHPIVFMKDVAYTAMSDLLQFMYQGEVQVSQENLTTFIKTAEALQIKGLTGDGNGSTECDNESVTEPKPKEIEMPKVVTSTSRSRPKSTTHPPLTPPAKRQRVSAPSEHAVTPTASSITKTEPPNPATHNTELIQFKMEPYDQSQSSVTIPDDAADETFNDDPLDETNADDTNEDYAMMEGGDEEPQAGTSADGSAGEGQGTVYFIEGKKYPRLILEENVFIICEKFEGKTRWRCSFNTKTRCKARLLSYGKIIECSSFHNHLPMFSKNEHNHLTSHSVTLIRRKNQK